MIEPLIKKFKPPIQEEPIANHDQKSKNDMISPDSILLNEKVKGDIYCLEEVVIDINGSVTGDIKSKSCIVNGEVTGNILCAEYIDVKNTAIIEGNIKSVSIEIEPGSIINGFINIDKKITLSALIKKMEEEIAGKIENVETRSEEKNPEFLPIKAPEIPQTVLELSIQPQEPENNLKIVQDTPKKSDNPLPLNDSWW